MKHPPTIEVNVYGETAGTGDQQVFLESYMYQRDDLCFQPTSLTALRIVLTEPAL
jgi:hypothetical protein